MMNDDDWKRHIEITEDLSYAPYDGTFKYKGKSISIECIERLLSTDEFCEYKTIGKDGTVWFNSIHKCPHCKGELSTKIFEEYVNLEP